MRVFGATIVLCAIVGASARGQSLTAEAAVTAGYSTEERTAVAATQARVFGDSTFGIRYYVEGAWGATTDTDVDAFGAAYPSRIQRTSRPPKRAAPLANTAGWYGCVRT